MDSESETIPRSMRHKRILKLAAENPGDPIDALADRVPSATPDLVEHVLEEYGDPAEANPTDGGATATDSLSGATADTPDLSSTVDTTASDSDTDAATTDLSNDADSGTELSGSSQDSDDATGTVPDTDEIEAHDISDSLTNSDETDGNAKRSNTPDPEALSEKQRETLRAIAEQPEATQREIAETLDVTAPTVSTRLSDISEFKWSDRKSFVASMCLSTNETTSTMNADIQSALDDLAERLRTVEDELSDVDPADDTDGLDPELVQKLVHACRDSEDISEEEELRLLERVLE